MELPRKGSHIARERCAFALHLLELRAIMIFILFRFFQRLFQRIDAVQEGEILFAKGNNLGAGGEIGGLRFPRSDMNDRNSCPRKSIARDLVGVAHLAVGRNPTGAGCIGR
jgi:hypothetical protein